MKGPMAFDTMSTGVRLLPDLIDPGQEERLVRALDDGPWETGMDAPVRQFGWWSERPLADHHGDPARFLGPLPDWAEQVVRRLHVMAPFDYAPDHIIALDLHPGTSGPAHPGEGRTVATLVLQSDLPTRFRRRDGAGSWHLTQVRRSLLVLTERFDSGWDRTMLPPDAPPLTGRCLTLTFRRMLAG